MTKHDQHSISALAQSVIEFFRVFSDPVFRSRPEFPVTQAPKAYTFIFGLERRAAALSSGAIFLAKRRRETLKS